MISKLANLTKSSFRSGPTSLNFCVFCNDSLEPPKIEEESDGGDSEEVTRLIFGGDKITSSFQTFFWRCLIGERQTEGVEDVVKREVEDKPEDEDELLLLPPRTEEGGKSEEIGVEGALRTCGSCSKTLVQLRRLHRELEVVEMILVQMFTQLQNAVKKGFKEGVLEEEGGSESLRELRGEIITQSERAIRIPMVVLENFGNRLPPQMSMSNPIVKTDDVSHLLEIFDDNERRNDDSWTMTENAEWSPEEGNDVTNHRKRSRRRRQPPQEKYSDSAFPPGRPRRRRKFLKGANFVQDECQEDGFHVSEMFTDLVAHSEDSKQPVSHQDGQSPTPGIPETSMEVVDSVVGTAEEECAFADGSSEGDFELRGSGDETDWSPSVSNSEEDDDYIPLSGQERESILRKCSSRPRRKPPRKPTAPKGTSKVPKSKLSKPKKATGTTTENFKATKRTRGSKPLPSSPVKEKESLTERKEWQCRHHMCFKCDLCSKVYFRQVKFRKHLDAHRENRIRMEHNSKDSRRCPVCRESVLLQEYNEHVLTHENEKKLADTIDDHQDKPFICNVGTCLRSFQVEENLRIHIEIDHDSSTPEAVSRVLKCELCYLTYDTTYHLKVHYRRAHKALFLSKALFPCPVCAHLFTTASGLISHMHSHTRPEELLCFVCKKTVKKSVTFGSRAELLHHFTECHSLTVSTSCDICKERFEDPFFLQGHLISVHKKAEPFICSFCGHYSYFVGDHIRHEETHEKGPLVGYACPDCPQGFGDSDALLAHRWKYHGAEGPRCDICGKEYSGFRSMELHKKRTHFSTEFHCRPCNKYFDCKSGLEAHKSTLHSEARPFTCETCGRNYKTQTDLRRHQLAHNPQFECLVCGRKFSRRTDLKNHAGMHDEVNMHVCEFCGHEFHSIKSWRKHVKNYHTGAKIIPMHQPQKRRRKACSWWTDREGNIVHAKNSDKVKEPKEGGEGIAGVVPAGCGESTISGIASQLSDLGANFPFPN